MNFEEVRIGNWIDEQGHYLQVGMINSEVLKSAEPIPLNEEWLVKFGFRNLDHSGIRVGYDFVISDRLRLLYRHLDIKVTLRFKDISCEVSCKYVHQLQNLYFALTNKELTIK